MLLSPVYANVRLETVCRCLCRDEPACVDRCVHYAVEHMSSGASLDGFSPRIRLPPTFDRLKAAAKFDSHTTILDNLIHAGKVPPTVAVMINNPREFRY